MTRFDCAVYGYDWAPRQFKVSIGVDADGGAERAVTAELVLSRAGHSYTIISLSSFSSPDFGSRYDPTTDDLPISVAGQLLAVKQTRGR